MQGLVEGLVGRGCIRGFSGMQAFIRGFSGVQGLLEGLVGGAGFIRGFRVDL